MPTAKSKPEEFSDFANVAVLPPNAIKNKITPHDPKTNIWNGKVNDTDADCSWYL